MSELTTQTEATEEAAPADTGTEETQETAPAVEPFEPSELTPYLEKLPEDIRNDPAIKNYKTVPDALKSLVHSQRMVGKKGLIPPDKHATDEEWTGFFRQVGMPEVADKYEVKAGEGFSEDLFNGFKETAFKNNVLPKQAQAMLDWYQSATEELTKATGAQQQRDEAQAIEQYKTSKGEAYDDTLSQAQAAVRRIGDPAFNDWLDKTGAGNNPVMIEALSKIGKYFKEDSVKGEGSHQFGMSKQEAQKKINTIMGDMKHPYFDKKHPSHNDAITEVQDLFERVSGEGDSGFIGQQVLNV